MPYDPKAPRERKLTFADAKAIRLRRLAGERLKVLAFDYGVSVNSIAKLCRGRTKMPEWIIPFESWETTRQRIRSIMEAL